MPGAVVASLQLPGRGAARDLLAAWLAPRQSALVLDNCEHLVTACAEFSQAMLERCAQLTIIATSREPLRVAGEARWPVPPLAARDARDMFEARARSVFPQFEVAASNRQVVTEICERLDRMPLAIELAAARIGTMTEQELLGQLSDRFRVLRGGFRTAPERLQTMSAAIDWSYRLLSEDEAMLFRRLSVFRGGFTLENAEAICAEGTTASTLDLVAGLVQKSMVVAERSKGSAGRYRLLESQLAYAEDRLREAGEFDRIHERHYRYFSDRVSAGGIRFGRLMAAWMAPESSNMWAALGWARDHAEDMGLGLAAQLTYDTFGDLAQMRILLEELLRVSPAGASVRMVALNSASVVAYKQGDYQATLSLAEAGLQLAREIGDIDGAAEALNWLACAYEGRGELDKAAKVWDETVALLKGSSNHRLTNMVMGAMADLAVQAADYAGAQNILAECLTSAWTLGDDARIATCLETLAWTQRGVGDHQASAASWRQALSMIRGVGARQLLMIDCLEGLSLAAEALKDDRQAVRLAAAADRMAREMSYRVDPWWTAQYEQSHMRVRARLGRGASEQAWNDGLSMSWDQAVEYALGEENSAAKAPSGALSRREFEIARLVAQGMTNRQIADKLVIAERTAEGHVEHIRNKLGFHSRAEIAVWLTQQAQVPSKS
jgi:non-specific serine/threonine protein kinase